MKTIYLGLMAAILSTAPAHAQSSIERRYSKEFSQCMDQSGGGDSAMRDCYGNEIGLQDARLNQAYVMIMRRLSPAKKSDLRTSERLWIRQRDIKCERHAAQEKGGTLYFVMLDACVLDETIKRTLFLENYNG